MHLARLVQASGLSCGLFGEFSTEALARIKASAPDISVGTDDEAGLPRVTVVDRLFDSDDAESVDLAAIETCRSKGVRVLCIVSGTLVPKLAADVLIVGYQPSSVENADNVHWGLDYAPVPPEAIDRRGTTRDRVRALIALGGHQDLDPLAVVCRALAPIKDIETVEILMSPVATDTKLANLELGAHQSVTVRRGVPDVMTLLAGAGLVIASFGNLVFEALAVGAPVCVVGQKAFQTDLAGKLAALDLCVSAGEVASGREADIRAAIERTLAQREDLSRRAQAAIDGRGFERIAGMIVEAARHG
jgi:hypothetical protein